MITVRVLFFALLREKMKQREALYSCQKGETVLEFAKRILTPQLGDHLHLKALLFAVNNQYVDTHYLLQEGDELAVIPPVAGG